MNEGRKRKKKKKNIYIYIYIKIRKEGRTEEETMVRD